MQKGFVLAVDIAEKVLCTLRKAPYGRKIDYLAGCAFYGGVLLCKERKVSSEAPSCLYVTSPDYTGRLADIAALAALCKRYGARLLVDNAHGAHLAFFAENMHPIALGADLCCDSAHKMLPALTGAALLHTSRKEYAPGLKQAMSLFGSTSPSYLIMASLDLCNAYLADRIKEDIAAALPRLNELRSSLSDRLTVGEALGAEEIEYDDEELLVLLMSPFSAAEDFGRLRAALESAVSGASRYKQLYFIENGGCNYEKCI